MATYTVDQAFEILQSHGITNSLQVVRRWLRDGKLIGVAHQNNRKVGWRIEKTALDAFIAWKKGHGTEALELGNLRADYDRIRVEFETLKTENERLLAENKLLKAEYEALKQSISNTAPEPQELTRDEVEAIWAGSHDRGQYKPPIQQSTYDCLMKLLFQNGENLTALYNSKYKKSYVCPNSGIKYSSAERLVRALIPRLLTWADLKERKIADLVQIRTEDFRVYRSNQSQLTSEQLAKMYRESVAYHGYDSKEMIKRSAIVDVLVEREEAMIYN